MSATAQANSIVSGQGWNGVVCREAYTTQREGGIDSLWVSFPSSNATTPLIGSMPVQLRELRTASAIGIIGHFLTGTLPACWGQNYSRANYPSSAGFDRATTLALGGNALISGALPAALGAGMPAGATIVLNRMGPKLVSPLPATLAGKTVVVAGSQGIYGSVPTGVAVAAGTSFDGSVRTFNGTAIGMASDLVSTLLAIQAGLDPGNVLGKLWTRATHPCTWAGVQCGDARAGGGVIGLILDSR